MSLNGSPTVAPPARRPSGAVVAPLFSERRARAVVHVLDEVPELCADLDPVACEVARDHCLAAKVLLKEEHWRPPVDAGSCRGWLGLLVVDGLLSRTVEVDGMRAQELLGPGDLLRPWDDEGAGASVATSIDWAVLQPTAIALLDARFAANAARWPGIAGALLRASVRRSSSRSLLLAVAKERRADDRLRLLFWHLADRWGRVTPDGVHLPLRLTHERIGELVCLRRPTVSMAIGLLKASGELDRRPDGTWRLSGDPPTPRPGRAAPRSA